MMPNLVPCPREVKLTGGAFVLPRAGAIGIADAAFAAAANRLRESLPGLRIVGAAPGLRDPIRFDLNRRLGSEAYRLTVRPAGIRIEAAGAAGADYAVSTLRQWMAGSGAGRPVPCVRINDAPRFEARGVYYDVTRGRVPHTERLIELANRLADMKINQLQLYIEHVFRFRAHPLIGRGCDPLDADDILALDAACRARHVELVPSLASFGHMTRVLSIPKYRHLAEDLGLGQYRDPEAGRRPGWIRRAWTLAPANPEVYRFLDSLFAELLPLFTSARFNVCCDEAYDMGMGQSYDLTRRRGKAGLFLDHILRLRELAGKYGKTIQIWGDMPLHHPEVIARLPKDVTVLDWNYGYAHDPRTLATFRGAGLRTYACPGTSSWVSLFPRLPESMSNIRRFAAGAARFGATGVMNTDWGDGGHYNFMEFSWFGYGFGAEQAWNPRADVASFPTRFAGAFLGAADPDLVRAILDLGEAAQVSLRPYYQSIWQHVFCTGPDDPIFRLRRPMGNRCVRGEIREQKIPWGPAFGRATAAKLQAARDVLARYAHRRDCDPARVLPYWVFAADTMIHAARKLAAFGVGGDGSPARRRALRRELAGLMRRFERLWMARNRRSEIRIALDRYRRALQALS